MSMPGGMELVIIFLVILLVFGAKRIPEIAQGLGKGIREFKDATSDIKKEMTTPVPPPQPQIQQAAVPPPVYVAPVPVAEPVVMSAPPPASPPLGDVPTDPSAPRL
ncbi:MAG TPA: twin-arginine translocase TatA/TatE family subunit [Rubricoccaceae bacterium]